ncbi:MAG: T9SS type A sorting domain-containing protein [Cytophagaceae bacterium]|nr:T9SS type A sorting domain-containing protein [Cytophagaceae bacterium]
MQKLFIFLSLIFLHTFSSAENIAVVVDNGDWKDESTWDKGRIPGDQDVVIIPAGVTCKISSNLYHAVPRQPDLTIKVYGTLLMVGTGQINIGCASTICVFGAGIIPQTGCNCNQINIGAQGAEWKGMADQSIIGGQCINGTCVLPVKLVSFTGKSENNKIFLSWVTMEEINFDHFEIERSLDGINFEKIETIKGHGIASSYDFCDPQIFTVTTYYRLKEVDRDNGYAYSTVITVESNLKVFVNAYPNPARADEALNLNVSGKLSAEEVTLVIKDLNGQQFFFAKINPIDNVSSPIDISALIPGIYILEVTGSEGIASEKLIIE